MALVLPFNAAGKVSETNMDFYSGVLLALRDLETEGVKTKLNVYDLQAGLPASFELEKNDFVLGPVTAADLSTVLERTEGRTTVISPLDQRAASHTQGHANFIQAPSSARNQYEDLAAWAAQDLGKADRIILVTEKVTGSTAPASGVREALLNAGISFQGVSLGQGETRSLPSSLTSQLTKGGENRIIVASEKETFVADMVRNLGILRGRGYDIVMYAPSRVRTFDSVEPNAYHQCSLHISSSYFVDYADTRVKSFVRTYRALFKTEPSQFAFQGYDTARYFVSLVSKYGPHWTKAISRETGKGLHTDFRFEAVPGGAFRNTAVRRIVYNTDYTTELDR
jgi:ABC-type branched-subunit amino acid transport system substrate-binding protein